VLGDSIEMPHGHSGHFEASGHFAVSGDEARHVAVFLLFELPAELVKLFLFGSLQIW